MGTVSGGGTVPRQRLKVNGLRILSAVLFGRSPLAVIVGKGSASSRSVLVVDQSQNDVLGGQYVLFNFVFGAEQECSLELRRDVRKFGC